MSASPQYVYDILVDYHTQVPRCERVAVKKVTDKLVLVEGRPELTHYSTRLPKSECSFTESDAWQRYTDGLVSRKFSLLKELRNIEDAIGRAKDAQERTTA